MTTYYNEEEYQDFLNEYTGRGDLKIHCFQVGGALPVEGATVTVHKLIGNDMVKIGEGITELSNSKICLVGQWSILWFLMQFLTLGFFMR